MKRKKQRRKESDESVIHQPLTAGFRMAIVFMSWMAVCIKPDTLKGFLTTLFVASITSCYEYTVLYLDYRDSLLSKVYGIGFFVSLFTLIYWSLCFFGIITLDINEFVFKTGPNSPIPLTVSWPFYVITIIPLIFPAIIACEQVLKSKPVALSTDKKPINKTG